MRDNFPGHFKLAEREIKNLWDNSIIALDANILLNLYRYSNETREIFFKIFEKSQKRIWIPYQSAKEFFDNRLNVISQQEKAYEEAIESLKSVEEQFTNSRQHPFLSEKLLKKFSKLREEICEELIENKNLHNNRIIEDKILIKIEKLFNKKVGNEFSKEKLEELYKIGENRFADKVPPGYKDADKKDSGEKNIRKFGDYIVWEQIIEKSSEEKTSVILVTDDRKEDWWIRFKGKTLGARPEIVKEFQDRTEQSFHMYQADRFLEYAREYFDINIKQKSIDEIRSLRKLDEETRLEKIQQRRDAKRQDYIRLLRNRHRNLLENISLVRTDKESKIEILKYEFQKMRKNPEGFNYGRIDDIQNQINLMAKEEEHLKAELDELNKDRLRINKNVQ